MRPVLVVGGALLALVSIPSYYYGPQYISQWAHSFVTSMTGGNTVSGVNMLREMGYPPLHLVITVFQYLLICGVFTGMGLATFGLVTKKPQKAIPVKIVAEESQMPPELQQTNSSPDKQPKQERDQVAYGVVNDVLTKLETQLKDIKNGYEMHKQSIEEEKRDLEQRERERMAKIIATGEVLIKEIPPAKFEERVKYYVELKNEETGLPIDLSLLADKFEKMRKMSDSRGRSDLTPSEFDSFRRFLD
ncbi:MAG: hypothetical protein KGI33_01485 [Thaumarchaeota archaeon]|nr:hypothetical protein [Nitrososphaerota archaeon]